MKHFVYFLFVLGIAFLSSCTDSKSGAGKDVISIPINVEEDRTLKMSDFIDSLRYIRLETNDACLIGEVSQFFPLKDKMAIVDQEYTHSIYFFDYDGSFLYKINDRGAGPEEYVNIGWVDICENEDRIFLYDISAGRILVYNLQGEYQEGSKVDFMFRSMKYLGNEKLACFTDFYMPGNDELVRGDQYPVLVIYDLSTKQVCKRILYENTGIVNTETIGQNENFSQGDGKCFFNYVLNNHIYQLDENGDFSKTFFLDFGVKNADRLAAYRKLLAEEDIPVQRFNDHYPDIYTTLRVLTNGKSLWYAFNNYTTMGTGFGIYNMESGKNLYGHDVGADPIRNDIDATPLLPRAFRGNCLYTLILPELAEFGQDRYEGLKELHLSEEDNPIVAVAFLKEEFAN